MYIKKALAQFGPVIALLSAFVWPMSAGLIIPTLDFGPGVGTVTSYINNFGGNSYCQLSPSLSICSLDIASNRPKNFLNQPDGASSGSISASTDANGAHLTASAGAAGQGSTVVTGSAGIFDTVYNNTGTAKKYQLTFHLDAELFTRSSAVDWLTLSLNGGTLFQTNLGYGGAGTYSFVNQDFTTGILTVAANSYSNWSVVLDTSVSVDSQANAIYAAGLPQGFMDAGNTLSLSAISIYDAQGNPITSSGLTSYAGFDYSQSNTAAAPEPASIGLLVAGCLLLGLRRKITS